MLQSLRMGDIIWNSLLLITSFAINILLLFAVETILSAYGVFAMEEIVDIWLYNFVASSIGAGFVVLSTTIVHTLREYTRINVDYHSALRETLKDGIEECIKEDKE